MQKTTPGESEAEAIIFRSSPKLDNRKWKNVAALDFCFNIQMAGSEFDMNNMEAWIHPAFLLSVQAGVGNSFMAHFGPLSSI